MKLARLSEIREKFKSTIDEIEDVPRDKDYPDLKKRYAELLKDPRWQERRSGILKRDKYKCRMCQDANSLQVHHIRYNGGYPWAALNKDMITLCRGCHASVEALKKDGIDINFGRISADVWRKLVTSYFCKEVAE